MGRGRAFAGMLAALLLGAAPAAATPPQASLEYVVKANYIIRFAAFVEWPSRAFAQPRSPVVICVAGRDPFGGALDQAARDQTAHGRPLAVRRPGTAEAVAGCHILYVGRGGEDLIPVETPPQAVLVITDAATSRNRGMIHFVVSGGRVRFHIDLQAASRSRLSMSSRLLNLALSVTGG